MKRREEIESEAERAAAIMRAHESAKRKRMGGRVRARGGRCRERKEASDFSSVTDGFHLTASLPPCLHRKKPEDVSLSIWAFVSV